jgi:hypothetical protein
MADANKWQAALQLHCIVHSGLHWQNSAAWLMQTTDKLHCSYSTALHNLQ